MQEFIPRSVGAFALPYGVQVEELPENVLQPYDNVEFSYSLRLFNRDYTWLGPAVLIREKDFEILMLHADEFPERDRCEGRYRFWFYQPGKYDKQWKLMQMINNFESLCSTHDNKRYISSVGKA